MGKPDVLEKFKTVQNQQTVKCKFRKSGRLHKCDERKQNHGEAKALQKGLRNSVAMIADLFQNITSGNMEKEWEQNTIKGQTLIST